VRQLQRVLGQHRKYILLEPHYKNLYFVADIPNLSTTSTVSNHSEWWVGRLWRVLGNTVSTYCLNSSIKIFILLQIYPIRVLMYLITLDDERDDYEGHRGDAVHPYCLNPSIKICILLQILDLKTRGDYSLFLNLIMSLFSPLFEFHLCCNIEGYIHR